MKLSQFSRPTPTNEAGPATDRQSPLKRGLSKIQVFAVALFAAFTFAFSGTTQAQSHPVKGKIAYVHKDGRIEGQVDWEGGHAAMGIEVKLKRGETVVATTHTNKHGAYLFDNLRRGEYTIAVNDWGMGLATATVHSTGRNTIKKDFTLEEIMIEGDLIYEEAIEEHPGIIETVPDSADHTSASPEVIDYPEPLCVESVEVLDICDLPAPPTTEEIMVSGTVVPIEQPTNPTPNNSNMDFHEPDFPPDLLIHPQSPAQAEASDDGAPDRIPESGSDAPGRRPAHARRAFCYCLP